VSAIFGCVYLDGRPQEISTGERMKSALQQWGPDGLAVVRSGSAIMGYANLAITPESLVMDMPVIDEQSENLFTAAARLDNRDELCDLFSIPAGERILVPDTRLVQHAWRKWGKDASAHLFGDWAMAAWDSRQRTLFLARDQLGYTGLYYYFHYPFFAFAADPEGLLALKEVKRQINETYVAAYLSMSFIGEEDDTCWAGVKLLPSGFSLEIAADGKQLRRYWDIGNIPTAGGLKDDEYVAGFLERYRAAVNVRLRSRLPVGTTLSAGLDSSSVTALAAHALQERGERLAAFTSVPLFYASHLVPGSLADEWPLAHAVSQQFDNIDHVAIDAATVTPLTGIERAVAITRSPQHAAANEFWIMALHDAAREQNIGVMLTGQMGNGGVSWSGGQDRIFMLFAQGKWDEGIKAMAAWKRYHGRSWFRAVAGRLVKPLLMPYWMRFRNIKAGAFRNEQGAINPHFADRVGLLQAKRWSNDKRSSGNLIDPFEERRLTLVYNGMFAGPLWHMMGAAFGMEVRDPTADIRLLEYCLSVPAEQDTYGGGERMLMRRAMEGILPPQVQWNRVRGKQAADVGLRLLQHPAEMDATLERLEAVPEVTQYLDVSLMRRVWHELQAEVTIQSSQRAAMILLRGIMGGCYLEQAGKSCLWNPNS